MEPQIRQALEITPASSYGTIDITTTGSVANPHFTFHLKNGVRADHLSIGPL
jgi:hypothetical protein